MKKPSTLRAPMFALTILAVTLLPNLLSSSVVAQSSLRPASKTNNPELTRMFNEDQSDRRPKNGKPADWGSVGGRDAARLARVRELYATKKLKTGADYYHAALILQHSSNSDDYLLAHEFCVAAISKGFDAKWLAAATEDRFLMNLGRPQRFATQFHSDGPNSPLHLYEVSEGVTDELRAALDVPSLAEAKKRGSISTEAQVLDKEHTAWIKIVLASVGTIKPGMTREELLKIFSTEGGVSNRLHRTYVYKQCPHIKIDVEFAPDGNVEDATSEKPADKIVKLSRPFLDHSVID